MGKKKIFASNNLVQLNSIFDHYDGAFFDTCAIIGALFLNGGSSVKDNDYAYILPIIGAIRNGLPVYTTDSVIRQLNSPKFLRYCSDAGHKGQLKLNTVKSLERELLSRDAIFETDDRRLSSYFLGNAELVECYKFLEEVDKDILKVAVASSLSGKKAALITNDSYIWGTWGTLIKKGHLDGVSENELGLFIRRGRKSYEKANPNFR